MPLWKSFKHFASKSQLPGLSVSGTLVGNGLNIWCRLECTSSGRHFSVTAVNIENLKYICFRFSHMFQLFQFLLRKKPSNIIRHQQIYIYEDSLIYVAVTNLSFESLYCGDFPMSTPYDFIDSFNPLSNINAGVIWKDKPDRVSVILTISQIFLCWLHAKI